MKTSLLRMTICTAVAVWAAATGIAADDPQSSGSSSSGSSSSTAGTSGSSWTSESAQIQTSTNSQRQTWNKPVLLSKLKDANVKSSQDENLGEIEEILVEPQTGKIQYVVLGRGGFLGIGEKHVAVPWEALSLQAENQFTLNVDKDRLKSAPTLESRSDYSQLSQPDYTVTIYRFFAVPVMGGAADQESPAVGGSDDIESDSSTQNTESTEGSTTEEDESSGAEDTSDPTPQR